MSRRLLDIQGVVVLALLAMVLVGADLRSFAAPQDAGKDQKKEKDQGAKAEAQAGPQEGLQNLGLRPREYPTQEGEWSRSARPWVGAYPQWTPYWTPYYSYSPWWAAPRTYPYKSYLYPPPVALEPRLGLQYNYPYAWQEGIQIPVDSDPLWTPSLGPFVGVVGATKAALRQAEQEALEEDAAKGGGQVPGENQAVSLMKEGQYRKAGKLLAAHFEQLEHPRYPLLLTEVFFALGKYDHAELILRHALASKNALRFLPRNVADHFPSREVYEEKLKKLISDSGAGEAGQPATDGGLRRKLKREVLVTYFLLHSSDPQKGLGILKRRMQEAPDDKVASVLYRSYLKHAF